MAATVWKGFISFGLVSVPIRLYSAARYSHISFHEIHKKCGHRVHQQLFCPYDEEVVPRSDVTMGYEVDDDKFVTVEREELKKLQPSSSSAMDITQFVKIADVDPLYFETSYFAVPEKAGRRAYTLLLDTMERLEVAALAQVTMHQRERMVIIRPYEHGLTLHTIYYPNEIHEVAGYGKDLEKDLKKQEVALSEQFAKQLIKPFHPEKYHDQYQERVHELIESKSKGKAGPKLVNSKPKAPVIDLMSALKQSLSANKGSEPKGKSAKAGKLKKSA